MKVLPLSSPQIVRWTVVIVIAWIFIELLAPMRMDWFHLPPHWIRPLALLAIGTGVYFLFFYRAEKKSKTWEDHPVIENISQQGELVNFSTNHFGDVDGIIAEVNGKSFIFHFPPHTAQAIMDIVSPGDRIEVKSGKVNGPTAQGLQLGEIKNLRTGANVIISGIPPFYPDLPGKEVVVSGVEFSLVYDQKERIRGIKMEDKFIELKPHEADRLQSLLKDAHEIAVVGVERDSASGFVNPEHKHIIRVIKITINGITYLMR